MAAAAGLTSLGFRIRASSNTYSKNNRIRRPQNVDGDFFVGTIVSNFTYFSRFTNTSFLGKKTKCSAEQIFELEIHVRKFGPNYNTCIDCDTCRWMAPEIFNRQDGMSAVFKQPTRDEERIKALQALLSCPTNSIRTERAPRDISEVHKMFPSPIDDQRIQGVYHCGHHSEKSYGATSYFITRPEGNILIDSPRYTKILSSNIKKMGGAHFMFLTHKDDVADHDKWSKELGCARILHVVDVCHSTADVEIKLEGSGPWALGSDVSLIHTPGHTEGSVCLLDKTRKVLFTGDHLLMDEFGLSILEHYNWFSGTFAIITWLSFYLEWDLYPKAELWGPPVSAQAVDPHVTCHIPVIGFNWLVLSINEYIPMSRNLLTQFPLPHFLAVSIQLNSVLKLLELDFEWILPGHGRRATFRDAAEKNLALRALLAAKGVKA
ncbi:hypothetical protein PHJA_000446400 [Phtheirospermum japonicum]|uniref:Metallo-beta-lactamase domain-containing protein n=1 Tax=Phtheirospermum japonicum TaxID=374723 RepID=A0A830BFI6_9LAMI|nr:hypothetical protein PHJA_000446400 [Phtheirospermum japonicum]